MPDDPTLILADATHALAEADAVLEQADRRVAERRRPGRPPGGRRAIDKPANAWSTGQLAWCIGMSSGFVLKEIAAGELQASVFGSEHRIHISEVQRYLASKGFPVPAWMTAA